MEAEIGVTQTEVKEHLGPPDARRGRKGFSPAASGESLVLLTP